MSTIPISTGRKFEFVTAQEWDRIGGDKLEHHDLHQAIAHLKKEPTGTAVRVRCAESDYRKKYHALRDKADRAGIFVKTKYRDGWLYMRKAAE